MKYRNGYLTAILVSSIVVFCVFGWVMNIHQLIYMNEITTMFILKVVGIFVFPLGVVLGWLT